MAGMSQTPIPRSVLPSLGNSVSSEHFVRDELNTSSHGDRRLEERHRLILQAAIEDPGASFPDMTSTDAELEGTYRFFSNKRVRPELVLAPHAQATADRVQSSGVVVVAHDTSEISFGAVSRGDLGLVGQGKSYGFDLHLSLAITADERRAPLGVLAIETFNRPFGSKRLSHGKNKSKEANITHRWLRGVERSRACAGADAVLIHVMDREADDFSLMAGMVRLGERFVIRQYHDRRLRPHAPPKVLDFVRDAPIVVTRDVPISARRPSPRKVHTSRHPFRAARVAHLQVRARSVTIPRTKAAGTLEPETRELALNLVLVDEVNPPEGAEPIQWALWTTDPIGSDADLLAIVDAYRARWRIEEYFKALKTGCALEKRQLETQHALRNALAIFIPVAWRLLLLRTLAHVDADAPASIALTALQVRALRAALRVRHRMDLPEAPTAREALLGVARMGGHIKANGDPGWIVLARGMDRLLSVELGLALSSTAM